MHTAASRTTWLAAALLLAGCSKPPADPLARATELARRFLIVDGHIDVPYRLSEQMEDVTVATAGGDFDWPRAVAGGLDAPFFSIYVPSEYEEKGGGKALALSLIAMVEDIAARAPDKFRMARSAAEVRSAAAAGRIALLMGMENGSPIEQNLANVDEFHERGIRYVTLCHAQDNHICDSSYDKRHSAKGLTPFGREVVQRMNEVGIIVDVSHVSDDTFWQVLELSQAPVFASHSSARHFTPGFERNLSDEMIQALAAKGGVVMINFGSSFLDAGYLKQDEARRAALAEALKKQGLAAGSPEAAEFTKRYEREHPIDPVDVRVVADHVDHVVRLAGIEHVGLGSDFDGVGDSLPKGLKDVSMYPNLLAVLLQRGYSEGDVERLCGANALRVLEAVEDYAEAH